MKNQTMNYKEYYNTIEYMSGPILLEDVPKIRCDVRAMVAYANAKGITTLEMTQEERNSFIITP